MEFHAREELDGSYFALISNFTWVQPLLITAAVSRFNVCEKEFDRHF